ncbi:hypothetical protein JCM8097_006164 [Rhodosporidiobolus ruineniae]
MPHTYIRAHTHTKYPHERFETSDVSFADWNFSYEHWLGLSYAPSIPPWYSSVPHVSWTRYTTAFAIGNRHDLLQALKGQLAKLDLVAKVCGQAVLFERWRRMPYSRREQLVLRIFENQVRRCEAQRYPFRRDECPEMVLSNLAKDLDFLEDLFHAQVGAPADEDYRIVRNEAWERLADPRKSGKTQLGAMSSGLQGWVEEGYLSRHLYLAQFTNLWIESLLGKDLPPLDQPLLSSSYRPTAADRRNFDELQVPDHPVSSPAMLNKRDAIKVCAGCSATADCQRSSWPTHKPACGKAFSASSSSPRPPSTRAPASKDQLAHLDYLAQFPLAIFGMSTSEEDHRGRVTNETDVLFDLPLFVRPFLDARRALLRLRDAATRTRDDVAVGVTVLFMTLAAKYGAASARATNDGQRALCVEMIRPLLDLTEGEIETAMAVAEAELATRDEVDLKLVAAVFEQLRKGKPDPAYRKQNIPDNRLSRDFLCGLLLRPNSFFAS